MSKRAFGDLELAILQILKSGSRMTVKEVHKILGEKDKYNTIMTVMLRLTEKKKLARERIGLHYEYWILPSSHSFLEDFKRKLFGVKTGEMVSYLLETSDSISLEELEKIEQALEKAKRKKQ